MLPLFLTWKFRRDDEIDGKRIHPSWLRTLREEMAILDPHSKVHSVAHIQSICMNIELSSAQLEQVTQRIQDKPNVQKQRFASCDHGQMAASVLFSTIMTQRLSEQLQLPPFLALDLTLSETRREKVFSYLVVLAVLSRIYFVVFGKYVPIWMQVGVPGHAMLQMLLPMTDDGSWRAFWFNSNGGRNSKYEEQRLNVIRSTKSALEKAESTAKLEEVDCTFNFQGEFGTCANWSLGMALYILCNPHPERLHAFWCEKISQQARLHAATLLDCIEALDMTFSTGLATALSAGKVDVYRIDSSTLEAMKTAIQNWFNALNALAEPQDTPITLDEIDQKQVLSFIETVRAAQSLPKEPPHILKLCTPSFISRMMQLHSEIEDGFRIHVCDVDHGCKYIVIAKRFDSRHTQQVDRFRITAAVTRHASEAGYGADVCGIVLCEQSADYETYGIIVLNYVDTAYPSTHEAVLKAEEQMHNDGIMHFQLVPSNIGVKGDHTVLIDFSKALPFFHSIPPCLRKLDLSSDATHELTPRDRNELHTWLSGMSADEFTFIRDHGELYIDSFPRDFQDWIIDILFK